MTEFNIVRLVPLIENRVVVAVDDDDNDNDEDDGASKFNVRCSIPIYLMFCFSATGHCVGSPAVRQ
jgi:hypothetical protein